MTCAVLGQPGRGVHAHVFGVAMFDVVLTVAAAFLLAKWTRIPFPLALLALFLAGVAAHRACGVRTTVDKLLFT